MVSCKVTEWEVGHDDGGEWRVPRKIDSCTCNDKPCGGFAGDGGSRNDQPQSP